MLRTLLAATEQIDDPEAAIADIKSQLKMEERLLKNSVGIMACHYEFADSGAVKAVCGALPFEVAGTISTLQGIPGRAGTLLLTLMVLTSDDVCFKTALTPSLKTNAARGIEETYKASTGGENPALILTYAPFMIENSGDEYTAVLSRVSGGAPCFGTLSIDDTADFHETYMIHNGVHYRDRMSLIMAFGNITPKFYLATISENRILEKSALISSSEGHILKEVNGRPVVEFFESMGLTKASETSYAMTSLPFMLDYNDGTPPVFKVFIHLTEQKYALCAGVMPEGSTLRIGVFDHEDVLLTTQKTLRDALGALGGASGALIYSCISRSMSLGADLLAEIELVGRELSGKLPFLMAYSGGEICPTRFNSGPEGPKGIRGAVNRFHNNTFILCVF
ncbi:MAG: FIST C-terminal domain-containing protein [Treponema sp.]|jgi:hypothetical protein|nr:FIST C-terminal domain-containing protein [Treponema sp.]